MYHARMRGKGDSARNFLFGGQCSDGTDVTNDLTYLALEERGELIPFLHIIAALILSS
jgi:hypothetical protein